MKKLWVNQDGSIFYIHHAEHGPLVETWTAGFPVKDGDIMAAQAARYSFERAMRARYGQAVDITYTT